MDEVQDVLAEGGDFAWVNVDGAGQLEKDDAAEGETVGCRLRVRQAEEAVGVGSGSRGTCLDADVNQVAVVAAAVAVENDAVEPADQFVGAAAVVFGDGLAVALAHELEYVAEFAE